MNQNITIILHEPHHPGNIGAVARAMKNMGLNQLALVSPQSFPHHTATERAAGAADVLENALITDNIEQAIGNCQWVFGTSAREREFPWPQLTPKLAADKIHQCTESAQKVAVIFGTETSGLPNDLLQRCDYHISIPTHPTYSSLNLGAAVQVIAYEIYQKTLEGEEFAEKWVGEKATASDLLGLLAHFTQISVALNFMDPQYPKKLLARIRRLFARTQLEKEEINILRGFLKAVQSRL
jgi:tRNA (cytidine32/uridine32-2'-O)-methyltransferase